MLSLNGNDPLRFQMRLPPGETIRQLSRSFSFQIFLLAFCISVSSSQNQIGMTVLGSMDECPPRTNPKQLIANSGVQTFLTPGYSKGRYQPNMDCHWVITASSQHRIQLTVHDSVIEDRLFTSCDDYLEVRDGASLNGSTLIAQWCGYNNPLSMTSTMDRMYIHFQTDQMLQKKGANMSFAEYVIPGCPPGWRSIGEHCYQLFSPNPPLPKGVTWVEAQFHCNHDRSNLLTITSQLEYTVILSTFGSEALNDPPWIGFHDAEQENRFEAVVPSVTPWPAPFPEFKEDHELKDCIYLDFKDTKSAYNVDDCRQKRSFICKKRKDGTTASYPPPESAIRQGLVGTAQIGGPLWLWLLLAVVLLFLLLILIPVCIRKYKRRQSRIHSANKSLLRTENPDNSEPRIRSVSRMVEEGNLGETTETAIPNGSAIPNGHNFDRTETLDENEREITEKVEMAETVESTMIPRPLPSLHQDGTLMANGKSKTGSRLGMGIPPIDRFDRPHIRLLDNVSAISLDEFWSKVGSKKIKNIQVAEKKESNT